MTVNGMSGWERKYRDAFSRPVYRPSRFVFWALLVTIALDVLVILWLVRG